MNKDLVAIFEYMEREKGIERDIVIDAIETALKVAARKSIKDEANVSVQINKKTGDIEVLCEKEIVEKVEQPSKEISLALARTFDPDCDVGQFIDIPITPANFGRIATQTARQVIGQKLKGAEKNVIYDKYRDKEGDIITGIVKRFARGSNIILDLGKVEAILPTKNYPKTENYKIGDKISAILLEVKNDIHGGAEVVLSRSHPDFVKKLFFLEVPELEDDTIEIVNIVRSAGYRTKIVVLTKDSKIDPVGSCVGVRGSRVKNVICELSGEKIDIIPFSKDPVELLQKSLAPIEIRKIRVNEDDRNISIVVDDADYATVIGKKGINARLTGKLIDYNLEVQKMSEFHKSIELQCLQIIENNDSWLDDELVLNSLNKLVMQNLVEAGFDTYRKLLRASTDELGSISGLSLDMAYKILEEVSKFRGDRH